MGDSLRLHHFWFSGRKPPILATPVSTRCNHGQLNPIKIMKTLLVRVLSSLRWVKSLAPASALLLLLGGVLLFGWVTRSRATLNLNIAPAGTNVVVSWTNP